jgi:peptidoglycan-N-acetylglucosamine deacetylase
MHNEGESRRKILQILPEIIQELKEKGYRLVTVPEILEMEK